jgi:hypothetical protein
MLTSYFCHTNANLFCVFTRILIQSRYVSADYLVVQRSPTECGVSECDREASKKRRPRPLRGCRAIKKNNFIDLILYMRKFTGQTDATISQHLRAVTA